MSYIHPTNLQAYPQLRCNFSEEDIPIEHLEFSVFFHMERNSNRSTIFFKALLDFDILELKNRFQNLLHIVQCYLKSPQFDNLIHSYAGFIDNAHPSVDKCVQFATISTTALPT